MYKKLISHILNIVQIVILISISFIFLKNINSIYDILEFCASCKKFVNNSDFSIFVSSKEVNLEKIKLLTNQIDFIFACVSGVLFYFFKRSEFSIYALRLCSGNKIVKMLVLLFIFLLMPYYILNQVQILNNTEVIPDFVTYFSKITKRIYFFIFINVVVSYFLSFSSNWTFRQKLYISMGFLFIFTFLSINLCIILVLCASDGLIMYNDKKNLFSFFFSQCMEEEYTPCEKEKIAAINELNEQKEKDQKFEILSPFISKIPVVGPIDSAVLKEERFKEKSTLLNEAVEKYTKCLSKEITDCLNKKGGCEFSSKKK